MENCNKTQTKYLNINSYCAICGVVANNKCGACSLVVYCSKEHQKAHWKKHKNECISYEVILNCIIIFNVIKII